MTERQFLECFVTTNDPDALQVFFERHGPMALAVCRTYTSGLETTTKDLAVVFRGTYKAGGVSDDPFSID